MAEKKLKLKLVRSISGRLPRHKATITALGLRRLNQVVELRDTPSIRGMVNQVNYLLQIEEIK